MSHREAWNANVHVELDKSSNASSRIAKQVLVVSEILPDNELDAELEKSLSPDLWAHLLVRVRKHIARTRITTSDVSKSDVPERPGRNCHSVNRKKRTSEAATIEPTSSKIQQLRHARVLIYLVGAVISCLKCSDDEKVEALRLVNAHHEKISVTPTLKVLIEKQTTIGDTEFKPDIVVLDYKKHRVFIIDVKVLWEGNNSRFKTDRRRKVVSYTPIKRYLLNKKHLESRYFHKVELDAFLVGALGTWDARNEAILSRLGMSTRTLRALAIKCCTASVESTLFQYAAHHHSPSPPSASGAESDGESPSTRLRHKPVRGIEHRHHEPRARHRSQSGERSRRDLRSSRSHRRCHDSEDYTSGSRAVSESSDRSSRRHHCLKRDDRHRSSCSSRVSHATHRRHRPRRDSDDDNYSSATESSRRSSRRARRQDSRSSEESAFGPSGSGTRHRTHTPENSALSEEEVDARPVHTSHNTARVASTGMSATYCHANE